MRIGHRANYFEEIKSIIHSYLTQQPFMHECDVTPIPSFFHSFYFYLLFVCIKLCLQTVSDCENDAQSRVRLDQDPFGDNNFNLPYLFCYFLILSLFLYITFFPFIGIHIWCELLWLWHWKMMDGNLVGLVKINWNIAETKLQYTYLNGNFRWQKK